MRNARINKYQKQLTDMQLFGTAGIRGITNYDITPELALGIGLAYGSEFSGKFAVARDTRYGAEMIKNAVVSGLLSTGHKVHDLGVVPLPVFARYVSDFMDGGIMLTGSHTPPDIMGIVAVGAAGQDLNRAKSEKIEEIYQNRKFKYVKWDMIGDSIQMDAVEHYTEFIEHQARNVDGFRIALDLANGAGAGIIDRILENLGIEVKCINCTKKHIPNRPSEPRSTTLGKLNAISKNYDFGAGMDIDADRVLFTHGYTVSEDIIGAIFATRFARRMVTPINSSSLVDYIAANYGIEVYYCPIGPPEIAESILRYKANFGYEETGKYIFPPETLWGDSVLSIVKLLNIMDSEGKTIESLISEFPKYYQVKEKIKVPRYVKKKLIEYIEKQVKSKPPEGVIETLTVDGVKMIYKDAWLLIRASGTEDVIRVFSDAESEKKAKVLVKFGIKLLNDVARAHGLTI